MRFRHLATKSWRISLPIGLVIYSLLCTFAYAENTSYKNPLEAWEQAQEYSLDHPVIAFAVYGRTDNATAQENGEKLKRFFERNNITSQYFLADEHDMGSSVGFYIQGVQYGPKALSEAMPLIRQVIQHFKQEYSARP